MQCFTTKALLIISCQQKRGAEESCHPVKVLKGNEYKRVEKLIPASCGAAPRPSSETWAPRGREFCEKRTSTDQNGVKITHSDSSVSS